MRIKRTYYQTYPLCGDRLDPGEKCECLARQKRREAERINKDLQINRMYESEAQQMVLQCCS